MEHIKVERYKMTKAYMMRHPRRRRRVRMNRRHENENAMPPDVTLELQHCHGHDTAKKQSQMLVLLLVGTLVGDGRTDFWGTTQMLIVPFCLPRNFRPAITPQITSGGIVLQPLCKKLCGGSDQSY